MTNQPTGINAATINAFRFRSAITTKAPCDGIIEIKGPDLAGIRDLVNMAPQEFADWLATDASKPVGDSHTSERTGHDPQYAVRRRGRTGDLQQT